MVSEHTETSRDDMSAALPNPSPRTPAVILGTSTLVDRVRTVGSRDHMR